MALSSFEAVCRACPKSQGAGAAPVAPPMFDGYRDLLDVKDLCEITGLSDQTVRREIRTGHLPGCLIGRKYYIPKPKFTEYVMEGGGLDG